jgi:predicted Zn-dependent protease
LKSVLWFLIGCGLLIAVAQAEAAEPRDPNLARARVHRQMIDAARAEHLRLEASGRLYPDTSLESYLNGLADRLIETTEAGGAEVRVHVIRDPYLKAYTLPGGFCYVSTGMLARIENEAQLASLLGHEIAHILHRHALCGVRYLHNETPGKEDFSITADFRLTAEIEADRDSLHMVVRAGYDPRETIRLYVHLQDELALEKAEEPLFSRTHPRLSRRIEMFQEMIAALPKEVCNGHTGSDTFRQHLLPVMLDNAEMDIGVGRFPQARITLVRYLESVPHDAKAHFLMGEIHRQQGLSDDLRRARTCYQRAIELDAGYAAPHRALGLMCYKAGETTAARYYLETSLALAPESMDNAYIRHYLSRLAP